MRRHLRDANVYALPGRCSGEPPEYYAEEDDFDVNAADTAELVARARNVARWIRRTPQIGRNDWTRMVHEHMRLLEELADRIESWQGEIA